MNSLGARLKFARDKKRLTQEAAAKVLGITNGTLSGYERNYRDPDTTMLAKLANLYGVTTDFLTGGAESIVEETQADVKKKEIMEIIHKTDDLKELELTLEVIKKMLGK